MGVKVQVRVLLNGREGLGCPPVSQQACTFNSRQGNCRTGSEAIIISLCHLSVCMNMHAHVRTVAALFAYS